MTWLERRKYGGKMPTAFSGMLLGMYVVMALALFVLPVPAQSGAAENLLCRGTYPCFSPAACQKAGGAYASCPEKCGGANRGYCYAQQPPTPLNIRIGSINEAVDLGAYIEAVYTYAIGVAAVLAAVMMMIGGIQWLTAAGDSGRVSAAKSRITNAIIGLLLTVCAWVFLNTINPSLVRLQMPRIPMVRPQSFVQCDEFRMQKACGQPFGLVEKQGAAEGAPTTERYEMTDDVNGPDVMTECVGASCALAGSEDGINTCQQITAAAATDTGTTGSSGTAGCPRCAPGYDCVSCIHDRQTCTGVGLNSSCCGSYCGFPDPSWSGFQELGRLIGRTAANPLGMSGNCHNGAHGTLCTGETECLGQKCVDLARWGAFFEVSTYVGFGGLLTRLVSGGICMNGTNGAPCNTDEDCAGGHVCLDDVGVHVCVSPVLGGYCTEDKHCGTGVCDKGINQCANQTGMVRCTDDRYCQSNYGDDYRCRHIGGRQSCTNFSAGSLCADESQCTSRKCVLRAIWNIPLFSSDVGICTDGLDGNGCDDDADCVSGMCFDNDGVGKICIGPSSDGGPCIFGQGAGGRGGCAEGLTCHEASHTCVRR